MTVLYIVIGLVALQRLAELALSAHNTRRLKAEGGIEAGAGHYPLFVSLHSSWLLAILLFTPKTAQAHLGLLSLFLLLQLGRIWVIARLGKYWTTRIITMPGVPLVKKGPYRFLRHPNYFIVACEIAVLPLAFGNLQAAIIWSAFNALLLGWRIRTENRALGKRRSLLPRVS